MWTLGEVASVGWIIKLITRKYLESIRNVLAILGGIRTITFFFEGVVSPVLAVVVAVAGGLGFTFRYWNRSTIKIPSTDSLFEIIFGDIFNDARIFVIPVNEFFDGDLGDHVSEESLHGKFIKRVLKGDSRRFYELTDAALSGVESTEVHRISGRCRKYPIGTVAKIDISDKRYLLAALSRTDTTTLKASATVPELWTCLVGIWDSVRIYSGGFNTHIPLVGGGLSGVGLPTRDLIEMILTSFVVCSKKNKVADKVTLVLNRNLQGEVDLATIRRN